MVVYVDGSVLLEEPLSLPLEESLSIVLEELLELVVVSQGTTIVPRLSPGSKLVSLRIDFAHGSHGEVQVDSDRTHVAMYLSPDCRVLVHS